MRRAINYGAWFLAVYMAVLVLVLLVNPPPPATSWHEPPPTTYSGPLKCWDAGHGMLNCIAPVPTRGSVH